jgi:transcriptional regulator with XRE-family HTH domain
MTRRNWKQARPNSAIDALRLCKEYAQEKKNLSIERIADRMGVTHDSLYKWLAAGRLPFILLPAFEHTCGCHFASEFAVASAGKVVISIPTGRAVTQGDLVELNACFGAALQLLADFYSAPGKADATETLAALTNHLQQVAWHHANVGTFANPELEF